MLPAITWISVVSAFAIKMGVCDCGSAVAAIISREKTASIHFIAANYKVEIQPEKSQIESKGEKKTGWRKQCSRHPVLSIS